MRIVIKPRRFVGTVRVPASKSHTIRRLLIASLAEGVSEIRSPLDALDTRSARAACRALGAEISAPGGNGAPFSWSVRGTGGAAGFARVPAPVDVGNSGTTLYFALAAASLGADETAFTGDGQIRRRSAAPLLDALSALGVTARSNGGCAPLTVRGPWRGGRVRLAAETSQYLSALLLAAPLAPAGTLTEIDVPLLNEQPYIAMTLSYLDDQGITYEKAGDFSFFRVPGGQTYRAAHGAVPGDFSSAAFPAAAAAVSGGSVTLLGLDPRDTQGDKALFDFLARMGAEVLWQRAADGAWELSVSVREPLSGGVFDLNATPDLLPAMAIIASRAEGETALVNVAHARIKETDRITVMAEELGALGIAARETPDGLVIQGTRGAARGGASPRVVKGHGDHRVVMALAAGALGADGPVEIDGAESAAVTWPDFFSALGAAADGPGGPTGNGA
ncbi:MAG: 3-phosphoshikimate 1-carboxyvinyltransferase [Spirochaetaceae bacterium]|jgi:3-phosphoshikimate 1-carboxyvinyltransferase|nr:3-phosphoshikimate 1-carboxyvinyltransferase [Spirochaetaceae bacterium]